MMICEYSYGPDRGLCISSRTTFFGGGEGVTGPRSPISRWMCWGSSSPSTLIYHEEGVSLLLTQRDWTPLANFKYGLTDYSNAPGFAWRYYALCFLASNRAVLA
jgi:hypothetical protein